MPRRSTMIVAGAFAAIAAAVAGWALVSERSSTALPGARHAALHINCPPGSHGTPRYARFGESLGYRRDAGGGSDLRERSLTAPYNR